MNKILQYYKTVYWHPFRKKLHWIGWHDDMCSKFKRYPIAEDYPRCTITNRYIKASISQSLLHNCFKSDLAFFNCYKDDDNFKRAAKPHFGRKNCYQVTDKIYPNQDIKIDLIMEEVDGIIDDVYADISIKVLIHGDTRQEFFDKLTVLVEEYRMKSV